MYRKSVCIVKKTPFLQGKTEILHQKRGFPIEEIGIMYRKSGCIVKKHRFCKEKLKFYIENEVFYRRK